MIAYGPLMLKPDEFWSLQPKEFYWMMEGLQLRQQMNRQQSVEGLHLQRMVVASLHQIMQAFSKNPKRVKVDKIWPIPEMDELIQKARQREEREIEQRLERVKHKFPTKIDQK